MSPTVVIVGGGLAGLAASAALADRGFSCTLLESRPRLGGRASSFLDPTTGSDVDNCQHVTMGCCTNFRYFCELTGIADLFRRETCLNFIGPNGQIDKFKANSLPAPFHLAGAFARLSYLSLRDKVALARGLKALARPVSDETESMPFSEWLVQHRQTKTAIERFWLVVLVSALSESLDRISVRHARKVFIDAFLRHRDGWYVDIPTVPLGEIYGGRLSDWFASKGVNIQLQSAANRLVVNDSQVSHLELQNGHAQTADDYLVALPFFRIATLIPTELMTKLEWRDIDQLQAAPISSVHLWFDRQITPLPHAVFVDRLSQWVFNRTVIGNERTPGNGVLNIKDSHYYQIVISASHALKGRTQADIQQQVIDDLALAWPVVRDARVLHSRQVTEHRAVFSPLPNIDQFRPSQKTSINNLHFAGDWTHTGWPATMEGAVRSGFLAAENILHRHGITEKLVKPDLPTSTLSKWLFGLSDESLFV